MMPVLHGIHGDMQPASCRLTFHCHARCGRDVSTLQSVLTAIGQLAVVNGQHVAELAVLNDVARIRQGQHGAILEPRDCLTSL